MFFREKAAVFAIGAAGYPVLELLYRKRTHWTMAFAGGASFLAIYRIHQSGRPFFSRCLRAALAVTGVELATGLVVNRLFRLGVWDYTGRRLNILGQVCPAYTGLWFGISALAAPICRGLRLYFLRAMAYNQNGYTGKISRTSKERNVCWRRFAPSRGMSGSITKTL